MPTKVGIDAFAVTRAKKAVDADLRHHDKTCSPSASSGLMNAYGSFAHHDGGKLAPVRQTFPGLESD
jgi:hypothetical protein